MQRRNAARQIQRSLLRGPFRHHRDVRGADERDLSEYESFRMQIRDGVNLNAALQVSPEFPRINQSRFHGSFIATRDQGVARAKRKLTRSSLSDE